MNWNWILLVWALAATAAALFFAYRSRINAAVADGKAKIAGELDTVRKAL